MRTIGVRAAKVMRTTLPNVVKIANIYGETRMNPNGSLTKAGKSSYRQLLRGNKAHSIEELIKKMRKSLMKGVKECQEEAARESALRQEIIRVSPEQWKSRITI